MAKQKKSVSQRVISLENSLHSTSVTGEATLSTAKIPQIFETTKSILEQTKEDLEKVNNRFNEELDKFEQGKMRSSDKFDLGQPSDILIASGLNASEITMTQSVLKKHLEKHGLTTQDIKNLPNAIQSPIMVYEWGTKAKNSVIITSIPRGNERVTVSIRMNINGKELQVNGISSVHGKSVERLLKEINTPNSDFAKDNLKYVNKKEVLDWFAMETPLVSSQIEQKLLSVAKIVQNFENPQEIQEKDEVNKRFNEASDNFKRGINAIRKIAEGEDFVPNAMYRTDLKQYSDAIGISFYWGVAGSKDKDYKGGYGLQHISAKHGTETLLNIIDVIDNGDIVRYVEGNKTVILGNGTYECVLALTNNGQQETWLLTGWKKNKKAGENGEVSTQHASTQTSPTFSREDLGAAFTDAKIQQIFETTKSILEQTKEDLEKVNNRFNEELQQQIDGTLAKDHTYQLGRPSEILQSAGIPNLPIELKASRLNSKSKQENHPFELGNVKNLVEALQNPLAVFEYGDKTKAQNIIIGIQKEGKNFLVGISINPLNLQINDVRGIFPKDNSEWLNWIAQDKALYLDKKRIQTLINQQRINLAEVEYLDLNSVAKIVQNFENPTIKEGKSDKNNFVEQRAYHGSGADFEKFDHSHMGEGEGAQAYGWGTYVTEVDGIAKEYATTIAEKNIENSTYEGVRIENVFNPFVRKILQEIISRYAGYRGRVALSEVKADYINELERHKKASYNRWKQCEKEYKAISSLKEAIERAEWYEKSEFWKTNIIIRKRI